MENLTAKKIVIGVGATLAGFILIFFVWKLTSTPSPQKTVEIAINQDDQVKGSPDSQVVLVEYSDFQCPACRSYHSMVKQLVEKYPEELTFVYRHFPLVQHKNAKKASYAAEAAGKQGKFWQMHDLIFENQDNWANGSNAKEVFQDYAKRLELDWEKFSQDMDSSAVTEKIENDIQSGIKSAVDSTPTFFLNGKKLRNPRTLQAFEEIIKAEIESLKK